MLLKTRKRTYLPLLYYRAKSGKACSACGQRCVHPAHECGGLSPRFGNVGGAVL